MLEAYAFRASRALTAFWKPKTVVSILHGTLPAAAAARSVITVILSTTNRHESATNGWSFFRVSDVDELLPHASQDVIAFRLHDPE